MQNGLPFSKVSTAKTVTPFFLARSEQQASKNYETAVALNQMICEALP
jgi:hypothetical protein